MCGAGTAGRYEWSLCRTENVEHLDQVDSAGRAERAADDGEAPVSPSRRAAVHLCSQASGGGVTSYVSRKMPDVGHPAAGKSKGKLENGEISLENGESLWDTSSHHGRARQRGGEGCTG